MKAGIVMNLHQITKFPFRQFLLVDEVLGIEVARADSAAQLDFDAVAGCPNWTVRGVVADVQCLIIGINQRGFKDRIGRIRNMAAGWLLGLERKQRLYAIISDFDGGSGDVEFPMLRVGDADVAR